MNETITISGSSTDFAVTNSNTTFWVYNTGSDTITLPFDPIETFGTEFEGIRNKFFEDKEIYYTREVLERTERDEALAALMG